MKEFRFKILREGDFLCRFNGDEIVIGNEDESYRIYKVIDFSVGKPNFFKDFEEVTIVKCDDITENISIIKMTDEYRIFRVVGFESGFPTFDDEFCLVVKRGIGRLQIFDSEEEVTITLPAQEST